MKLPIIGKKGLGVGSLPSIGIAFCVAFIIFGIASVILEEVKNDQTTDGFAYNATQAGQTAIQKITDWGAIIGIVCAAAIVLGIIIGTLGRGTGGAM